MNFRNARLQIDNEQTNNNSKHKLFSCNRVYVNDEQSIKEVEKEMKTVGTFICKLSN